MEVYIMNLSNTDIFYPYDFRVDRKTILGNPFDMKDERSRDKVCDGYEAWFEKYLPTLIPYLNKILQALKKYGTVRLFCWCAPKRCHAETIKRWLLKQVENEHD